MAQEQEGADKVLLFQNSTYMFKKKKEGKGAYFHLQALSIRGWSPKGRRGKENTLPVTDRIPTWDLSVYSRMLQPVTVGILTYMSSFLKSVTVFCGANS